jgi:hypothetical protein
VEGNKTGEELKEEDKDVVEKKSKFSVFTLFLYFISIYSFHYFFLNSPLSKHLLTPCYFGLK